MIFARLRPVNGGQHLTAFVGPLLVVGIISALATPTAAQDAPAADDELLGFSRYLPADTTGYVSVLQGDKVVRAVLESRAWAKIEALPEVAEALAQVRAKLDSDDVPPPARAALDLLAAMFSSEATFAATAESSRQLLNVVRLAALAVPTFAPTQWQPGSPEAQALEEIRGPMRTDWLSAVQDFRMPPMIFAWRLREIERYRPFIDLAIGQGWAAAQREIERAPPPVRTALGRIYSQTKLGEVAAHRLRFRLGDMVPPQEIERGMRGAPLSDAERAVLVGALAGLSIEVHLAYVGDYLTLVVGPDDAVMRQIAERYEGRSKETLAASSGFASLRADIKPSSLLVLYSDGEHAQRELLRIIVPILDQLSDPNFLALLGAPPTVATVVQNFKLNLLNVAAASPMRQEAVVSLDQGIKQIARLEYDAEPPAAAAEPLAAPQLVPVGAVAYSAYRRAGIEGIAEQVKMGLRQSLEEMAALRQRFAGEPRMEAFVDGRIALIDDVIQLLDAKISTLDGEVGLVLGPFSLLSLQVPREAPIENLPIPTLGLAIGSSDSGQALAGAAELIAKIVEILEMPGEGVPARIELVEQDLDGTPIRGLPPGLLPAQGFEPHLAQLGEFVVFSTSHALTKQMRDAQAGKAANITTAAEHRAKQELLPDSAERMTFVNGDALHAELKAEAAAIFALIRKNNERLPEEQVAQLARAEACVGVALEVVRCFRSAASSVVVEGDTHKLREWVHLEDLAP